MTANTAGRPVPTSWIDAQPPHLIDTAIEMVRSDDPDAWNLLGGDRSPRYALWAYLCLGHGDTLSYTATMHLTESLCGPAGHSAYQAGMSPAEAALSLVGGTAQRPRPRLALEPLRSPSPTHRSGGGGPVSPAEHRHHLVWLGAGLRRAAHDAGIDLPVEFAQCVAVDGIRHCDQLAVTPIGHGVAIHTAPADDRRLPVLLGYADAAGQWYRDGSRHATPSPTPTAGVDLGTVSLA